MPHAFEPLAFAINFMAPCVKGVSSVELDMKIRVFICTPRTDRKRIKVIVSHPIPHIGQNDATNQPKDTESEVCQELSAS